MNKACYRATVPHLHRNLALKVSSRQKIREDTAKLREGEFRDNFLTYVRCLKIWGRMPSLAEEEDGLEDDPDAGSAGMEEYDAEFGGVFTGDFPDGSAEEVEEAWKSLAVVIQECKYIADLIWVCQNQLPPCLLRALDQSHPSCRLDLRTFRLRSLRDPVTDSHELALIQSQHLHSISVKTVGLDPDGNPDHNKSAIFPVVALAPNLEHLNIVLPRTASSPQLLRVLRARNTRKVPWRGFVPPLHTAGRGALCSLAYFGQRGMSLNDIQSWPRYTCFSKLRFLNLGRVSDPLVLRSIIQNVKLTSLISFRVSLEPTSNNHGPLIHELESLLEHLEPLEEIGLAGSLSNSIFHKAIERHCQTLHRLAINPYQHAYRPQPWLEAIGPEEIRRIESDCPRLEYLKISIPYSSAAGACDISPFCPNIRQLKELTLCIDSRGSGTSPGRIARRIWNLIGKAKTVSRLSRLLIEDSDVCLRFPRCLDMLTYVDRLLSYLRE